MSSQSSASTLRTRRQPPSPIDPNQQDHDHEHDHENDRQKSQSQSSASSTSGTSATFPGGGSQRGLPAVKGTIGGIESPRSTRSRHGYTSSISTSTIRDGREDHDPPTPSTLSGSTYILPDWALDSNSDHQQQGTPKAISSQPVFRADPTIKSCLLDLKLESKSEIARLFGVA